MIKPNTASVPMGLSIEERSETMKASELIEELQRKMDDFGDLEVRFAELSEIVTASKVYEVEDITIEEFIGTEDVIVIWDK